MTTDPALMFAVDEDDDAVAAFAKASASKHKKLLVNSRMRKRRKVDYREGKSYATTWLTRMLNFFS